MITAGRLRELFSYNPDTGEFTRLVTTSHNARAGQVTRGCKSRHYLVIRVDDRLYYAHRLAWLYTHGHFPPVGLDVDHINRDKCDNRIENLRLATRQANNRNRATPNKNNTSSGVRGVHRNEKGKWVAHITVDYSFINLGHFDTLIEAHEARRVAERKYFGDFGRAA
jgi:hypothetical protein